jgi:hypothetical protein
MAQYLLLFVGLAAPVETSDAQTAEYGRRWGEWMGELAANGTLLSGAPLEPRGFVVGKDGRSDLRLNTVDVGGFMLIQASSDAEAVAVARQAPHIALGGTTIVRPVLVRESAGAATTRRAPA